MQEFFVGNFRVDILRNQIIHEGDVIALEPKVLEVLKVLAQTPGEVVSHQELLDTVWPDMVVAPNALQRCIGQLRKALNDDGKKQAVIQTHPKRGYSLTAPVTLRTDLSGKNEARRSPENTPKSSENSETIKSVNNHLLLTFGIIISIILLYLAIMSSNTDTKTSDLSRFNQLTPLTATDNSEFYSVFSPDGRFVAFSRQTPDKGGQFWLKDLSSNQEIRISKDAGRFGQPTWSEDGQRLAFIDLGDCTSNCQPKPCYDIRTLYLPLAMTEPQVSSLLLECVKTPYQGLQWLNTNELVFIQYHETLTELVKLNINNKKQSVIYSTKDRTPYSISYSLKNKQIALMQESKSLQQELVLIQAETGNTTPKRFVSPVKYGSWLRWYPVWNHDGTALLFSAGNRLYQLDLKGNLNSHMIPTFQDISRPMYQPNGSSIAMTLGKVDRDIAQLTLVDANTATPYLEKSLARSILRESDAQFQPNGNGVAFFSDRGGSKQLWLSSEDKLTQVSNVPASISLDYFVWSPNGKQLAALSEKQLMLFNLDGKVQPINLNFRAIKLFQWTEHNQLLMSTVDKQGVKLILFDVQTGGVSELYQGYVNWAQYHDGITYYTAREHQIRNVFNGAASDIPELHQVKSWSRFFVRDHKMFIMSVKDDFYRFNLNTKELERLFHYPDTSVAISDVSENKNNFLISRFVSAKKEIVLLSGSPEE